MHFPHSISPRCDIYRARQQRAHYFPNFFSATAIPSRRFLAWKSNLWMINWLNRKIARNFRDITHRINLCPIKPGKIGRENKHPQVFLLSISLSLPPSPLFFTSFSPFSRKDRLKILNVDFDRSKFIDNLHSREKYYFYFENSTRIYYRQYCKKKGGKNLVRGFIRE